MAKRAKPTIRKTLGEVAVDLDLTLDSIKRWRAEGMPGRSGRYVLPDVIRWARTEGPWSRHRKEMQPQEDPLLTGGDESDGLERYRLAKAKHAELDYEHRKGELIERQKARDIFGRWAVLIRRMGERLATRYGNDAAEIVNEALEECADVVQGGLSNVDD